MSKLGGGFWGAGSSSESDSASSSDSDANVAAPSAARTTGRFQVSGSSSGTFFSHRHGHSARECTASEHGMQGWSIRFYAASLSYKAGADNDLAPCQIQPCALLQISDCLQDALRPK